jgi:hypothetical protein
MCSKRCNTLPYSCSDTAPCIPASAELCVDQRQEELLKYHRTYSKGGSFFTVEDFGDKVTRSHGRNMASSGNVLNEDSPLFEVPYGVTHQLTD